MNGKNNTYNTVFIYNILPCETWNAHSSNLPLPYQMTDNLYLKGEIRINKKTIILKYLKYMSRNP